VKFCRDIMKLS